MMSIPNHNDSASPAEQLATQAQLLLEQERRLDAAERQQELMRREVERLRAQLELNRPGGYTIAGYASVRGIYMDVNRANMLDRRAVKLSQEYGYDISRTSDPRFGSENVYHADILKEVFAEED